MGWFEKLFSVNNSSEKEQPAPPACGENASAAEVAKSKQMEEKRKEREKHKKAADGMRLVVSGAKIQCTLCTNPIGTLMVTSLTPTIQNKPIATIKDKEKANLMFTGTCSKSPNAAVPCLAVIVPGMWQETGKVMVQNSSPLLFKSTIKCMFGGVDIKFVDCGQTP